MAQGNVLIIDDDDMLVSAVAHKLAGRGYGVLTAGTGMEGRRMISSENPDLLILDLMLPDEDGMRICHDVRRGSDLPIIILSARAEHADRVLGLEMGADDYVTKPFDLSELVARVKSLLRRVALMGAGSPPSDGKLEAYGIVMDPRTHTVTAGGKLLALRPIEYRILETLMQDPGSVVPTDDIVRAVWGDGASGLRTLAVHVTNLRNKLAEATGRRDLVRNVRSIGYRLG